MPKLKSQIESKTQIYRIRNFGGCYSFDIGILKFGFRGMRSLYSQGPNTSELFPSGEWVDEICRGKVEGINDLEIDLSLFGQLILSN